MNGSGENIHEIFVYNVLGIGNYGISVVRDQWATVRT